MYYKAFGGLCMNSNLISLGVKVEFELYDSLGVKVGKKLQGKFIKEMDDTEICILSTKDEQVSLLPEDWQELKELKNSQTLRVHASFHHDLHGLLKFRGTVTEIDVKKSDLSFRISIDEDFKEIQKRKYLRVYCFLKAKYKLVTNPEEDFDDNKDEAGYGDARTRNISFRGVQIFFIKNEEIAKEDLVDLLLWLNDDYCIKMRCSVIRVFEFEERRRKRYDLGLSIININYEDEQLMKEYITRSLMMNTLYWGESPF